MPSDRSERTKYREKEYWEQRFEEESHDDESAKHDWFSQYDAFRHHVTKICPPSTIKSILVLGCGNSSLSAELLKDYPQAIITSSDYSPVVINYMKEKYKDIPNLKWSVEDIRDLNNSQSYDMVIEKGVLDALVAGSQSPWPNELDASCKEDVDRAIKSIATVVRDEKRFLSISFASPMLRKPLLLRRFDVTAHSFLGSFTGFEYYVYECKAHGKTDEEIDAENDAAEQLLKTQPIYEYSEPIPEDVNVIDVFGFDFDP